MFPVSGRGSPPELDAEEYFSYSEDPLLLLNILARFVLPSKLKVSSGLLQVWILLEYLNLRTKAFSSGVVVVMMLVLASARA